MVMYSHTPLACSHTQLRAVQFMPMLHLNTDVTMHDTNVNAYCDVAV